MGDRRDRVVLTNNARVETRLHLRQPFKFALEHAFDGNTRPPRDHRSDVVARDLLSQETISARRSLAFNLCELALQTQPLCMKLARALVLALTRSIIGDRVQSLTQAVLFASGLVKLLTWAAGPLS
jgi:hypothetical protein